jgi:hypothetical protein
MVNIWPLSHIYSFVDSVWFVTRNRIMFISCQNCSLKIRPNVWRLNISYNFIIFPCIWLVTPPMVLQVYIWGWNASDLFHITILKTNYIQPWITRCSNFKQVMYILVHLVAYNHQLQASICIKWTTPICKSCKKNGA